MLLIKNNPYRTIGLLVGATAKEQDRQIKRLKQFIEAEQEPEDDFSFPTFGQLNRTVDSVTDAASKLNLDSDKINAAIFWFYNGSHTDEPAFDAIKVGDLDQVLNIWSKLTASTDVTQRNASAYNNLSTLYLSGILEGTNSKEAILEQGISLKLKFLESDFIKDFKTLATDETFKTTKKELQLLFLNQVQVEIEKSGGVTSINLLAIITKQEFSAKEDFLKGFVQKPIEEIEKKIEESKTKRKANKGNAVKIGEALYKQTSKNLKQLKSILGASSVKYSSIADKVANEILQCSIDYFNYCQENEGDINYFETAWKLAKSTKTIAIGKLTKDRIIDSLTTLEEMKDRELSQAIAALQSIKYAYEEACKQIDKQVDELRYDTFPGFKGGAPMKINKLNVSINWSKVEEMKRNALAWEKVVELIQKAIPPQNIDKIKNANNPTKVNEYKNMVNFIMGKLSQSYKNKVAYISYWEIPSTSSSLSSATTKRTYRPTTSSQSDFDFAENAWWILALLGLVIGVALGGGAGALVGAMIGGSIGSKFK